MFGAVANAGTDIVALIRRTLDALGYTGDTALTAFTDGCSGLRAILAAAGFTGPLSLRPNPSMANFPTRLSK